MTKKWTFKETFTKKYES